MPNEYPIMNIRAKYADQTPEGKDIDTELEKKPDAESLNDGTFEGSFKSLKVDMLNSDESEISAQKPVVEVMTGYGAHVMSIDPNTIITNVYTGAVKNGNKLTLVTAVNIEVSSAAYDRLAYLTYMSVPNAIANKIFPAFGSTLDSRQLILIVDEVVTNQKTAIGFVQKSDSTLYFRAYLPADLEVGKTYYVRYELTLLLSEGLI